MSRKPFISALCGLSLGVFLAGTTLAQQPPASTTTTSTTTSVKKVPTSKKAPTKVEETSTISTTTTTPPPPAPSPAVAPKPTVTTTGTSLSGSPTTTAGNKPRTVYDQETLKKMEDKLCVEGFKAHVGSESKNVCNSIATPPDIAYSCFWDKDGPPAFPSTNQGPCTLDFSEHRGDVVITREKWKDNPPMKYGAKVMCCYRSSK